LGLSLFYVPGGQQAVVFSASDYLPRDADLSTPKLDGYGPGLHFALPFLETISFYSFEPVTAALAADEQDQVAEAATATEPATASPTETVLPSDTPMPSPTAQGGGTGQLAFASNRSGQFQVYLLDPAAPDDVLQLTDMEGGACQPEWSPDGSQIVFISPCTQNKDEYDGSFLYLVDAAGGEPQALGIEGYDPAWSPDGSRIATTVMDGGFRPQIYLYDVESASFGNLSNSSGQEFMPAWSPDGNFIAYVSTSSGQRQIFTMDLNGENKQFFSRSSDRSNAYPVWTSDGLAIAFVQSPLSGGIPSLRIASWESGGSDRAQDESALAPTSMPMRELAFSVDGQWLAFSSNPDGANHDLYIIAAGGGSATQITSDEGLDVDPAWRP
jgi:Tol biopolymer transport system component